MNRYTSTQRLTRRRNPYVSPTQKPPPKPYEYRTFPGKKERRQWSILTTDLDEYTFLTSLHSIFKSPATWNRSFEELKDAH